MQLKRLNAVWSIKGVIDASFTRSTKAAREALASLRKEQTAENKTIASLRKQLRSGTLSFEEAKQAASSLQEALERRDTRAKRIKELNQEVAASNTRFKQLRGTLTKSLATITAVAAAVTVLALNIKNVNRELQLQEGIARATSSNLLDVRASGLLLQNLLGDTGLGEAATASLQQVASGVAAIGTPFQDVSLFVKNAIVGIDTLSLRGKTNEQIMLRYAAAYESMSEQQRAVFAQQFGNEFAQGISELAGKSLKERREALKTAREQGRVDKDWQGSIGEVSKAFTRLKNSLKPLGAILASSVAPVLKDISSAVQAVIHPIAQWLAANPALTKVLGTLATALGITAAAILGVQAALIVAKVAWVALNATFLASPLGWLVLAIAAVGAAIYLLVKNWETVSKPFIKAWNWVKDAIVGVWDTLKSGNNVVLALVSVFAPFIGIPLLVWKNWSRIKSALFKLWDTLKEKFKSFIHFSTGLLLKFLNGINKFSSKIGLSIDTSAIEDIHAGTAAAPRGGGPLRQATQEAAVSRREETTINNTINVQGVDDPETTAAVVERRQRRTYNESALGRGIN